MNATAPLVALLAMIVGYVDAYGFLTYKTFLSFMSGNTTRTGYALGEGQFASALPSLTAIIALACGAMIGTTVIQAGGRKSRRIVFALVAALQSLVIATTGTVGITDLARIATMSLAMGILNSSVTRIGGQTVSVGFVTGTIARLGNNLALAWRGVPLKDPTSPLDTHARRAVQLASVWMAFLVGAVLAGMATPHLAVWTLVPPVIILLALASVSGAPERQ